MSGVKDVARELASQYAQEKCLALLTTGRSGVTSPSDGEDIGEDDDDGSKRQRRKKDKSEMDADELLLSSDKGKQLSSQQRRQLRNKVSARQFRLRRKEYITHLEGLVKDLDTKMKELKVEMGNLRDENILLKQQVELETKPVITHQSASPQASRMQAGPSNHHPDLRPADIVRNDVVVMHGMMHESRPHTQGPPQGPPQGPIRAMNHAPNHPVHSVQPVPNQAGPSTYGGPAHAPMRAATQGAQVPQGPQGPQGSYALHDPQGPQGPGSQADDVIFGPATSQPPPAGYADELVGLSPNVGSLLPQFNWSDWPLGYEPREGYTHQTERNQDMIGLPETSIYQSALPEIEKPQETETETEGTSAEETDEARLRLALEAAEDMFARLDAQLSGLRLSEE